MLSHGSYIGSAYIYTYNRVLYVRMIDDDGICALVLLGSKKCTLRLRRARL